MSQINSKVVKHELASSEECNINDTGYVSAHQMQWTKWKWRGAQALSYEVTVNVK